MIYIKEKLHDGIAKASAENELYDYKKGDVIWTKIYSHEICDFVRIPWYIVYKTRKTKKGQNLILLPYQKYQGVNLK